jgi:Carboxypeptidase regulatory-like domain
MRNVITTLACVVWLSAIASAALAQSQLGAGSISGTISDSTGAVISGATVTITNTGAGLVRRLTTSDSGQFSAKVETQNFASLL